MTARPEPFGIGRVRVRVHSGPRSDGRWRWRADTQADGDHRVTVWSGWATRDEADAAVREAIASQPIPVRRRLTVPTATARLVAALDARWDDDTPGIPTGLPALPILRPGVAFDDELPPEPEALESSLGLAPRCPECRRRTPGGGLCWRCAADEVRP